MQVLPNWIVQSVIGSIQLHRSSDGRYISAELYLMVLEIFHGRSPSMLSSVHDLIIAKVEFYMVVTCASCEFCSNKFICSRRLVQRTTRSNYHNNVR